MLSIIMSFIVPFVFFDSFKSQYAIMQAHHYELKRYWKQQSKTLIDLLTIKVLLFSAFYVLHKSFFVLIVLFLISNLLFLHEKVKMKYTVRAKRIIILYFALTISMLLITSTKFIYSFFVLLSFFSLYLIVLSFLCNVMENIIMRKYVKEAKEMVKDKKIIGITGSFGKTSCKNILFNMMENFYNVSKTPKSYNNKVGIVKSVRENVDGYTDYFICEYGDDKVGGMNKLINIVKPNVSLITDIGTQHLLTFKSIENICREKIKLAECLNVDEWVVLNNDNNYLNDKKRNLKCHVITYGIDNESDIMARNIKIKSDGLSFDILIDKTKVKHIKTNLLGIHNVRNILGCIGVLKCLEFDFKNFAKAIANIKPIEHRLELKTLQGMKIIDDSFNSNENGFRNAVDILAMMKEEKYIITPGIIEQGKNGEIVNYNLGKYMKDKIDFAILVEKNATFIKKGLIDNGFDINKIVVKDNFNEAFEFAKKINNNNKIFLIENDLPSIYLK